MNKGSRIRLLKARQIITNEALNEACKLISDLTDRLELENFGPDAEKSILLAVAAGKYGLAQPGDSAYSLRDMSTEEAMAVLIQAQGG